MRIPAAVTKDGNRVSSEANISIDLSTSQLPPDGTRATITVAEEGSRLQTVEVLYWTPSVRQAKPQSAHAAESTACENSTLQTVLTSHGQGFELRTDVPSTFEALVIDSCGKPLTSGAVRIFFPSEKASISLEHVVGGRWLGSWTPSLSVERINGEIQAVSADGAASSRVPIYGTVIGPTR